MKTVDPIGSTGRLFVLKCGRIPKHIAIIMDGNRRFAKQKYIARQQGHMKGFDKLTEVYCLSSYLLCHIL